jgi:hypothetical protein
MAPFTSVTHSSIFARVVLLTTTTIYISVGRIIYANRRHFRELSGPDSTAVKPFSNPKPEPLALKTTKVQITTSKAFSELNNQPFNSNSPVKIAPYVVKIESSRIHLLKEQRQVQLIADRAAWAYLKCAMLFFIALLITWVRLPFSIRISSHSAFSFPLLFFAIPPHPTAHSLFPLCIRN